MYNNYTHDIDIYFYLWSNKFFIFKWIQFIKYKQDKIF